MSRDYEVPLILGSSRVIRSRRVHQRTQHPRERALGRSLFSVDHEQRIVTLSPIFKWYESDFVNAMRDASISDQAGITGYLARFASPGLREDLTRAKNYRIVHPQYDWSINGAQP